MRAAVFHGRRDIRLEDVPEPEVRPGSVKVKVDWCGICGTDLHEYLAGPIFIPPPGSPHPITGETLPLTLGHEFAGSVVDVSAQRTTLRLRGEHVRDLLSGGCAIDLHPRVFLRGSAAQTLLGQAGVVLMALDDTGTHYQIVVRSSFAGYVTSWLLDAATEYRTTR